MEYHKNIPDDQETTLILPMAGQGSRFEKAGYTLPKPLLPVDRNLPMVIKAAECLPATTHKIFICKKNHVQLYKIDQEILHHFPGSIILQIEGNTLGTPCTCDIAFQQHSIDPEKPIIISVCDTAMVYDVEKYKQFIEDETTDIIVWGFSDVPSMQTFPENYSWIATDEKGLVRKLIRQNQKPTTMTHACAGKIWFRKGKFFQQGLQTIYQHNVKKNGEYRLGDVVTCLITMGYCCRMVHIHPYSDWNIPYEYERYHYWYDKFCGDK
jgi:bifunctional N-acetylglucosamine-1-phosphate-uridyltransferase/glucosamine-1-phosphate-acetyltransferase GlmU-like protein